MLVFSSCNFLARRPVWDCDDRAGRQCNTVHMHIYTWRTPAAYNVGRTKQRHWPKNEWKIANKHYYHRMQLCICQFVSRARWQQAATAWIGLTKDYPEHENLFKHYQLQSCENQYSFWLACSFFLLIDSNLSESISNRNKGDPFWTALAIDLG